MVLHHGEDPVARYLGWSKRIPFAVSGYDTLRDNGACQCDFVKPGTADDLDWELHCRLLMIL